MSDKISDLHTVKEESERDNNEDEDDLSRVNSEYGSSNVVRTKEGMREFSAEYMLQTVIEEFVFE